jgi:hypothetical protein
MSFVRTVVLFAWVAIVAGCGGSGRQDPPDAAAPDGVAGDGAGGDPAPGDAPGDLPGDEEQAGDEQAPDTSDLPGAGDAPPDACLPDCGGKACGSDGCGGSCGACSGGTECKLGACVAAGPCGVCPAGMTCAGDPAHPGWCRKAGCDGIDAAGACKDNVVLFCEGGDLYGLDCDLGGFAACGWVEGAEVFDCVCVPDCSSGKVCGGDGCGGSCGLCTTGLGCAPDGRSCVPFAGSCCEARPGQAGCEDLPVAACVCAADPWCCEVEWDATCVALVDSEMCGQCCKPACEGRACGDDGCGGNCGGCPPGRFCSPGFQCDACSCGTKECGTDECGAVCGECDPGESCQAGACVAFAGDCCATHDEAGCAEVAVADCVCKAHPECCAGAWDLLCVHFVDALGCGQCCTPDCTDRECGDDGCLGDCGPCGDGRYCDDEYACRDCGCTGKECGDDGCGNPCGASGGACPDGQYCDADGKCTSLGAGR